MSELDDTAALEVAFEEARLARQAAKQAAKEALGDDWATDAGWIATSAAFEAAQDALVAHRRYWREIGVAVGAFVDRAHDGARIEAVKVRNNDGS